MDNNLIKKKKVFEFLGKDYILLGKKVKVVHEDKQFVELLETQFDFHSTFVLPKKQFIRLTKKVKK